LMQERVPQKIEESPVVSVDLRECHIWALARERVNHVGQPVAAVLANDRATAEDAADLVGVSIDAAQPVLDPEEALRPGSPAVDPSTSDNLVATIQMQKGDVDGALERAARRLQLRVRSGRVAATPLEGRGVIARTDPDGGLVVWTSTQVPHLVRRAIARQLGIAEAEVRVLTPDVGGGFGAKVHVYPEDVFIPYLARTLGVPVRWVEDRQEHFLASAHGRDQIHNLDVGFDEDGRIEALSDDFIQDCGVSFPFPMSSAYNVVSHLPGLLRIRNLRVRGRCALTNKAPNVPYRGSGRPESSFARDRLLSAIARELGLDFLTVLKRNLIGASEMPYRSGIPYRDGEEITYDGCDMPALLEKLERRLDEQPSARDRGDENGDEPALRRGLGFGTYTEGTGVGPFEGATVSLNERGTIDVYLGGAASQGQSHETAFAQVIADEFDVELDQVSVREGDTSLQRYGVGTYASRTMTNAGAAAVLAARQLKERIREVAGELLEIAPEDVEITGGCVVPRGVPAKAVPLGDVYAAALPGPGARLGSDREPGMVERHYFVPQTVTWGYGAVAAAVTVDRETGIVIVDGITIVHDCGRIINPIVVEGQIDGGVAQGVGAALFEAITYDESGNCITSSMVDYILPSAVEVPEVAQDHLEIASTMNPLGVKGVGEAGIIGTASAVVNAVEAALGSDVRHHELLDMTPVTAETVLRATGVLK
ncbi:MAG TPA: xanthine dehydrogenase family protein molybdopterin-binding subunit, partial [Chloroflexota bacterium]